MSDVPVPSGKAGRRPVTVDLAQLESLAHIGCTLGEVGLVIGCSDRTIKRLLADTERPEFRAAWERGKANLKMSLRRLQLRHATREGSSAVQMLIHMSKHHLGETDQAALTHMNPDGSPIGGDAQKRYVVILPHNNRDPLTPEQQQLPVAAPDDDAD